jgi:hypothetical protein
VRNYSGPALFVKIGFTLYYLFSYNMFTRERIGVACQADKTVNSMLNVAVAFALIGGVLTALVAYNWIIYMILLSFVFGLLYGSLAGWIHSLPIRPWMHLTTLEGMAGPAFFRAFSVIECTTGGMYLVVKKKQLCPCVYWGLYCSDMHQFCEVLLFFTEDDVKFINALKGGADVVM